MKYKKFRQKLLKNPEIKKEYLKEKFKEILRTEVEFVVSKGGGEKKNLNKVRNE